MPEYNYSFSAPLKNAFDYLHNEWKYKPVGFVSYGGVSGGMRAVQQFKQVVTTLTMLPVPMQVALTELRPAPARRSLRAGRGRRRCCQDDARRARPASRPRSRPSR